VTCSGDPRNPNSYASRSPSFIGKVNDLPRLSRDDPLKSMTIRAAEYLRMDNMVGSLEVGKYADFVVLKNDFLKVADEEFGQNRCC